MANLRSNNINFVKKTSSQSTVNGNGAIASDKTSHFEYMKLRETQKSQVEQSIERLYGPGALGIGFRNRRSLLEQQRQSPSKEDSIAKIDNAKSLPRVFKHLRPEFRSQLFGNNLNCPSDAYSLSNSQSSSKENISVNSVKCKADGPIVRHIPIQLEGDHSNVKKAEISCLESSINNSFTKLDVNGKSNVLKTIEKPIIKVVNNLGHNYNLRSRSMTPKNVNVIGKSNILVPKALNFMQSGKENLVMPKISSNETPAKVEKEFDSGGKHFLKVVEVEVDFLNKYADLIENDVNEFGNVMGEELKGKLFATVGKIRLLVTQKIKQFKGLCNKNINGSPAEDFPTTDDDLAGFWDMVSLQIDSVKDLITEWKCVKQNGWKEFTPVHNKETKTQRPMQKVKTTLTAEQRAQIEARKKAQEERRKAMREAIMAKRKQAKEMEQVERFGPKVAT